ncbi:MULTISPECIES: type III secretion system stator protein SctL [Pseudomonas]|jgi:type III secretion protein L|uniref:type III secretion system stator protein SctL n=1 Tax=Pseudomonas TaxID=286 RepID=UPI0008E458BA|nr:MULTISPECIES: type III secretion system stator protein SctL [Pseudomonas]QDH63202.1 HrpE/YscL family type III secretion apparatus protein [Pseudomonas azotoformans]SFS27513.1 type III secretion protein L [Pseudomonas sp. NFACC42-2]
MLCRYTVELPRDASGLSRCLIPREELANWEHANQLISHAKAQADELINQTERQCELLLEKASLDVWQRADAQFKRWERDRQAMCDNLEEYATSITNQAIRRLLGETVAPQRLSALLKQLLADQIQEIDAALLCHPQDFEEVKQYLAHHKATLWKLHHDETIPAQTLVLKTDEGDFRISWNSMLDAFFNHGRDYRIDI